MTRSLGTMSEQRGQVSRAPVGANEACRGNNRVLVVEDHAVMAAGLELALSQRDWEVETTSAESPAEIIEHARRMHPECVLLSVRLGSGVRARTTLIKPLAATGARVLLLTAERRRIALARFLEAGADGWIGGDAALEELDSTLHRLLDGQSAIGKTIRSSLLNELRRERESEQRARAVFDELTLREARVLAAMSDGLTADEIAREHVVAISTVRSQIRAVLQKLDVRSQLAAVAVASSHRDLLPQRGDDPPERREAESHGAEQPSVTAMGIA